MKTFLVSVYICFGIFAFPFTVVAHIQISEVYPAPPSSQKEWIEIENTGTTVIDLSQHELYDLAGNSISFENQFINPSDFAIAESSSVINNGGDTIFLKDPTGNVIDSVTTPAEISSTESYTRCNNDWIVTDAISKSASNESACAFPTETPIPSPTKPSSHQPRITHPNDVASTPSSIPTPVDSVFHTLTPTQSHPEPVLFSDLHKPHVTKPTRTPTPSYSSKVYSLSKREKPVFYSQVKLGILLSLVTCSVNFVYSINKYIKNL